MKPFIALALALPMLAPLARAEDSLEAASRAQSGYLLKNFRLNSVNFARKSRGFFPHRVIDVGIIKQFNLVAPCIDGYTWGHNEREVWVQGGCQAKFRAQLEKKGLIGSPGGGAEEPGNIPGLPGLPGIPGIPGLPFFSSKEAAKDGQSTESTFEMTLESTTGRTTAIYFGQGEAVSKIELVEQTSSAACVEKVSFGKPENMNSVFVTDGCSGRFNITVQIKQ